MGYLRKALSISTLGLSNLVLDDEPKQPVRATRARARPRKRAKPKATARAKAGNGRTRAKAGTSPSRSEPKAARATKTARAKPPPARARAGASAKRQASARTRTGATSAAKAPGKRSTARRANATKATAAKTAAAKTSTRRTTGGSASAARKPAARKPTARRQVPSTPAAQAKQPLAGPPQPVQRPQSDLQTEPATAAASTTARTGALGNGVSLALERITTLHEHGALTEREFAAAKARILGTVSTVGAPEAPATAFPSIEANVAAARRIDGYADRDREPSPARPGAPGDI